MFWKWIKIYFRAYSGPFRWQVKSFVFNFQTFIDFLFWEIRISQIYKISVDYFCILNSFIRENLVCFYQVLRNFVVIAQKSEKKSGEFYPILNNLVGAQNGVGLLEVLFDIESPSEKLIDLYRRCFLLNTLRSITISLDFIIKFLFFLLLFFWLKYLSIF